MAAGYRLFNVRLKSKYLLSPSMLRCVFTGDDICQMKSDGPDQRIKLLFAAENGETPNMPVSDSWYEDYLALPRQQRPVLRIYTLRAVSHEQKQAIVDVVMHGETGPASRWAFHAQPGDTLQIVAPNALAEEDSGGYEWLPHHQVRQALLIADETALPAAMNILEMLAKQANPPQVQAFFEVPLREDCLTSVEFPFAHLYWLPREETGSTVWGERLLAAIQETLPLPVAACEKPYEKVNETGDDELLWERADGNQPFYGWVAAESTAVKRLRRFLLDECCLDRSCINFMAYWSHRV